MRDGLELVLADAAELVLAGASGWFTLESLAPISYKSPPVALPDSVVKERGHARGLSMRYCVCLCLVAAALTPAAAGEFPFEGYVAADSAEIASGPGRRFYVTDKLPRGTKVEVYREDDAGWLAIRPPEGSFSWLPAEHVEELEDGVGKVKSAAECWIGTAIEQVPEHKSQVSLKVGELVEIIDRKQVKTADGQAVWLKIAPPAGEFRFIHSRDVSREPVAVDIPEPEEPIAVDSETAQEDSATSEPRQFRPSESAIALRDIDEVRSKLAAMREDLAGLAGSSKDARRLPRPSAPNAIGDVELAQYKSSVESDRPLSPDGFVPRRRRESESLAAAPVTSQARTRTQFEPLPRVAQSRPLATAINPVTSQPTSVNASSSFAARLEQLDVELSLMLAQDKSTWNLAGIRQRVEQLVASGPTPAERGQARLLLDKIKQFEETFDVSGYGPLAAASGTGGEAGAGSPYAPRYDAKGWLKPVISRAKPAAPYAVVDADGKPLCFVTPSPGLNLGRYANKEVGLYGTRGYIEALKTPHLVAERVIDLGRHAEQVSSLPVR